MVGRGLLLPFLFLMLMLTPALQAETFVRNEFPEYAVSIEIPPGWEVVEYEDGITIYQYPDDEWNGMMVFFLFLAFLFPFTLDGEEFSF